MAQLRTGSDVRQNHPTTRVEAFTARTPVKFQDFMDGICSHHRPGRGVEGGDRPRVRTPPGRHQQGLPQDFVDARCVGWTGAGMGNWVLPWVRALLVAMTDVARSEGHPGRLQKRSVRRSGGAPHSYSSAMHWGGEPRPLAESARRADREYGVRIAPFRAQRASPVLDTHGRSRIGTSGLAAHGLSTGSQARSDPRWLSCPQAWEGPRSCPQSSRYVRICRALCTMVGS